MNIKTFFTDIKRKI